ncbi:hypothetical protein L7F22_009103 [Adiantum nelumboides]|nr:hypothetical protein [Adiantum nelumboides]
MESGDANTLSGAHGGADGERSCRKSAVDADGEQEEEELVVVVFKANWCGPCRMMAPVYSELSRKFPQTIFLKIDVDEMQFRLSAHVITRECFVDAIAIEPSNLQMSITAAELTRHSSRPLPVHCINFARYAFALFLERKLWFLIVRSYVC